MTTLSESAALGWRIVHGPSIASGSRAAERDDYTQVALDLRLRDALTRTIVAGEAGVVP